MGVRGTGRGFFEQYEKMVSMAAQASAIVHVRKRKLHM